MYRFNPTRMMAHANVSMEVNPEGAYVRWEDVEESLAELDLERGRIEVLTKRVAELEKLQQEVEAWHQEGLETVAKDGLIVHLAFSMGAWWASFKWRFNHALRT